MTDIHSFLYSFGDQMLEYIWFPLFTWTVIALPITVLLKWTDKISPVYQYHFRIGLQLTLPLGIVGAALAPLFNSGTAATSSSAFLVITNPLPAISASPSTVTTFDLFDPMIWMGIISIILVGGALFYVTKLLVYCLQLKKLEQNHHFQPLCQCSELVSNLPRIDSKAANSLIAYSKKETIPFTYGWYKTKIIIPEDLKSDPESLSMAVQHELTHIKHNDFLINGINILIKSLFWFHPLLHYLYNSSKDYREITCDNEVLAYNTFSKKKYASLLFELAKREHRTNIALSMAVNPSSLKKRIQIMSGETTFTSKLKTSSLISLTSVLLIVLTISCTDLTDGSITKSKVEQKQGEMQRPAENTSPLYVINGEQWSDSKVVKNKLARLKTKYIKSIDILKREKGTDKYGEAGKFGAIEIQVNNPDQAFEDLKTDEEIRTGLKKQNNQEDYFIAVEKMPKLIGGLASLQKKITYPELARKAGIEGRVIIQFIVNKQGQVEDPEIIRGIGGGADEEALRVVKQAKFKPGIQQGKNVRVQYSMPITFKLATNKAR
ncbi:M56 family metallopeptidase [Fodinibius saliphilus]|uniref:M56 family metallopeptidase n=1 Tax=Fodinibius saliphilus TaxID=1920650 RepID=UPI00110949A3|nr:M56 family metallopeptidase [Fodinibius saliphilus]